jgi:hypothetical protein
MDCDCDQFVEKHFAPWLKREIIYAAKTTMQRK